jgi:hypothetical protein
VTATDAHVLDLRADGWDLLCPPTCGDDCPIRAAVSGYAFTRPPPQRLGRHPVHLADDGSVVVDLDRSVFDGTDRIDHSTARPPIVQTRVNRLASSEPIDPRDWVGRNR